jgi:hypothetical protein
MSIVEEPRPAALLARVKNLLLRPGSEWETIDREPATPQGLLLGYVAPLAAIPAVCGLIGMQVFGVGAFGFNYKPPLFASLTSAVLTFVLALVSVAVLALVVDALAPTFKGERNRTQALKVAAYGGTASWLAGVFAIVPALAILGLLGLYSLFLIYKGLPRLMKAPADQALPYTAVTILCAVVLSIVVAAVLTPVAMMGGGAAALGGAAAGGAAVITTPGGGRIDSAALESQAAQLEAAAKAMEAAAGGAGGTPVAALPSGALQGMLPASLAGLPRTEISSADMGAGGAGGGMAEATYSAGDRRIELSLVDMGAMGALAGMAGAMNVRSNSETADGYERTTTVNGQIVTERWDRASNSGAYGRMVGGRFMVQAEGAGVDMAALKQAVDGVDRGRLERLARGG